MKRASITDAKNRLSALLERVRHGETVLIEDRGVPIARLESVVAPGSADDGRLARLERQGLASPPSASPPREILASRPPSARGGARATDALLAERRESR